MTSPRFHLGRSCCEVTVVVQSSLLAEALGLSGPLPLRVDRAPAEGVRDRETKKKRRPLGWSMLVLGITVGP